MDSILVAAVWGGLAGVFGGLVGSIVGLVFPQKARPIVVTVFLVGALGASRAISPLQASDMLGLEMVSDILTERQLAQAEAQIQAVPESERELLDLIRELDPELYQEMLSSTLRAVSENTDQSEAVSEVRLHMGEITGQRRPLLNNAELAIFSELMVAQYQVLSEVNNDWCMAYANAALPGHVTQDDLPDEFLELEMQLYRVILQSELQGGEMLDAKIVEGFVEPAVQTVFAQYGQDAVATFAYFENPASSYPEDSCLIFADYLAELNAQAGEKRGPLWRTLLASDL